MAAAALPARAMAADSEGVSGAQFLRIGVDARSVALGETGATVSGARSVFYNPAGLAGSAGTELFLSQVQWVMDVNYSNLAVARRFSSGVWAFSAGYLTTGGMDKYDKSGNKLSGTFSGSDMAAGLSYAAEPGPGLGLGATVKYISSKLDDSGAAVPALDAGLKWAAMPGKLVLGTALRNMGPGLKFESGRAALPLNLKFGGAYIINVPDESGLQRKVAVLADGNYVKDSGLYGNFGVEYLADYSEGGRFAVRAGWRTDAADSASAISAGLGFDLNSYAIDYSYSGMGDLGQVHRLSLSLKFGVK